MCVRPGGSPGRSFVKMDEGRQLAGRHEPSPRYCMDRKRNSQARRASSGLQPCAVEREVHDPKLRPVRALPAIEHQAAGGVQGAPTIFHERLPERLDVPTVR